MIPSGSEYEVFHGDTIPHMMERMEEQSMDLLITSVPFPRIYAYTSFAADLGNNEDLGSETKIHFSYLFRAIRKIMKPGRIVCIHCMQIPGLRGGRETFDFRGLLIKLAKRAGLLYQYDWCYLKNAQAQAIRTHSHKLLFVTLERDRSMSCGAMPDYILKFIAPGENKVPIDSPDITREEWIRWAEAAWDWRDIRETDTLNTKAAKSEEDTRHIAPLQLGLINRLVRLYSNPGEIVFDPFSGIGSTGYVALKLDRRYYGTEIKKEYYEQSLKNLNKARLAAIDSKRTLFDMVPPAGPAVGSEPVDEETEIPEESSPEPAAGV